MIDQLFRILGGGTCRESKYIVVSTFQIVFSCYLIGFFAGGFKFAMVSVKEDGTEKQDWLKCDESDLDCFLIVH